MNNRNYHNTTSSINGTTPEPYYTRSQQFVQSPSASSSNGYIVQCHKCINVYDAPNNSLSERQNNRKKVKCSHCGDTVELKVNSQPESGSFEDEQYQYAGTVSKDSKVTAHSSRETNKPAKYRYTVINSVKAVYTNADAERYIHGLADIYNIRSYSKGRDFLECLMKSICGQKREFACDHSFTNEHGETHYILVFVRTFQDHIEIGYSYQQINDESTIGEANTGNTVLLPERKSEQWLKERALESLHAHTQVVRSFHDNHYHDDRSIDHSDQYSPMSYSNPTAGKKSGR